MNKYIILELLRSFQPFSRCKIIRNERLSSSLSGSLHEYRYRRWWWHEVIHVWNKLKLKVFLARGAKHSLILTSQSFVWLFSSFITTTLILRLSLWRRRGFILFPFTWLKTFSWELVQSKNLQNAGNEVSDAHNILEEAQNLRPRWRPPSSILLHTLLVSLLFPLLVSSP